MKTQSSRLVIPALIVTSALGLTMVAQTATLKTGPVRAPQLEGHAIPLLSPGAVPARDSKRDKKTTVRRLVTQANAPASLITKLLASEKAMAMVTIKGRTVRPRPNSLMWELSNGGYLIIKTIDRKVTPMQEVDVYLKDGVWMIKGCLCLNKLSEGDDCTIASATQHTCNSEEDCCGWVEITLEP